MAGTNYQLVLCQVRAAVSALKDIRGLPKMPGDAVSSLRSPDVLDFLQYVFGFQVLFSNSSCSAMLF